jgi:FAD/FMN-containing dehydrogenase
MAQAALASPREERCRAASVDARARCRFARVLPALPARAQIAGAALAHSAYLADFTEACDALLRDDRELCHARLRAGLTMSRTNEGMFLGREHAKFVQPVSGMNAYFTAVTARPAVSSRRKPQVPLHSHSEGHLLPAASADGDRAAQNSNVLSINSAVGRDSMKRREFVSSALVATGSLSAFKFTEVLARSGPLPNIEAVTSDGRQITLLSSEVLDLAKQLHGQLLLAGDAGYEQARQLLNPSFDKHPALIVQPVDVSDIQTAVKFARAHSLLLAVKCGGHSHSGQSTCERGMQIDLKTFRGVKVDTPARRVSAKGGTLLGQIDKEAMAQGMVTPLGTVSHTGVGGLTLGGGFGRVARRFGMAIDNLTSVDVVTADGQLVHTSKSDNPELFWGLRGGSGNFGVVTNFEFQLHPMQRQVIAGKLTFPFEKARDVLSMYADYAPKAPDDLYFDPVIVLPPGGAPGVAQLDVCYSGPAQDAERILAPLRKVGTPIADSIKAMDYVDVQRSGDMNDPRALATYLKGGFIASVSGDLITALVDNMRGDPRRVTGMFFQHCGGACSRVPENATAFAHRYALANMMIMSGWPMGEPGSADHMAAIRTHWSKLEKFTRGFYVNDMPREVTSQDINANYRGNYARLVALKNQYDPTNLFRLNANVEPKKT